MVILITGGSGFIGHHLIRKLIDEGHQVRILDKQKPEQNVEWIKGDILEKDDISRACRDVSYIFHLAAIADVNVALSDPRYCIEVNEIGTINILEAARSYEVDRVILASTTWVYGNQEKVNENSPIPHPDHIYTKTKIGQENLIYNWYKTYGLPYTILRYDIPYGPMMRSNLVLAIFTRRAKLGQSVTVFGNGEQGRCFIYVEDLAEGNVSSLQESGKNEIFNLAGNEFITINDILRILKNYFSNLNVEYAPSRVGDFLGVKVDINKAKQRLDWQPKISYEEGVKRYLDSIH